MALGGYADRIARIDLSTRSVRYEPLPEADARLYVGARGLGVKFLLDNGPQVDPLSPDNLLCIMNGPLTGTHVKMSGRLAVVTKSPLTGTCTDSHVGGWTAAKLKWAGFDGLVFKGKADAPVYAFVENGAVELRDASPVWGKGVHDTVAFMRAQYGEEVSILAIGQAGENLVRYAAMINEHDRAAGRGGTGCVAGSKLLKAIIIRAPKEKMPKPADRLAFREADKRASRAINESPITGPRKGGLSVYGTGVVMNVINTIGALPTRNSRATQFAMADQISGEWVKEHILVDDPTCHACPVACKKEVDTTNGELGLHMESTEYESMWSLGANCDNGDARAIAYLINLCNDFGVDTIEHGNVLSMAMEASERGLTGEKVSWGDVKRMIELTRQMAHREGIGGILAEGTARAAARFGDPSIAMVVKGQAIPAYDPRGLKGMGIGYATSNRGACHLRGYSPAAEAFGIPYKMDPLAWEGKGELLKLFQDLHAASDSFDICKFSAFAEGAEEYAMQYAAVTGVPATADDILRLGERVYNLERYYNNLCGFGGTDDSLPERFLKEPGSGPAANSVCELELMKADYYRARGWENGVVPEAKLRELQILPV